MDLRDRLQEKAVARLVLHQEVADELVREIGDFGLEKGGIGVFAEPDVGVEYRQVPVLEETGELFLKG